MADRTVLVVEDEESVREVIVLAMESIRGISASSVANGAEAVQMAMLLRPAVIVLDLKLPDMDGLEVMKALRSSADTADIPVIVCTASPKVSVGALEAGAVACVAKPFNLDELRNAVRRYCPPSQPAA